MFCEKCGTKLAEETLFCTNCGAAVEAVAELDVAPVPVPKIKSEKQLLYTQVRKMAAVEMLKGFAWFALGVAITVFTAGFLLTYGLIIYGSYAFLRSLYYFILPGELVKKVNK